MAGQALHDGRVVGRAARRNDRRDRRVGLAAQADGGGAGHLRSPVKDLTVVSYGGPDVGLLCAAGRVRKVVYGFVTLDTIALDPHSGRPARPGHRSDGDRRRDVLLGLQAAAPRCRSSPPGPDSVRTCCGSIPELRLVRSP